METDAVRQVIGELDSFVESDLPFDQLTEFTLETAAAVRSQPERSVSDVLGAVMDAFRDPEAAALRPNPTGNSPLTHIAAQQAHQHGAGSASETDREWRAGYAPQR